NRYVIKTDQQPQSAQRSRVTPTQILRKIQVTQQMKLKGRRLVLQRKMRTKHHRVFTQGDPHRPVIKVCRTHARLRSPFEDQEVWACPKARPTQDSRHDVDWPVRPANRTT